ncbi:MAG: hypothetical protein QNJ67_00905 [Kiloniellales bacterium]|nr:hypothetical protein [Kiloniellales bacterium]
MRRWAEAAVFAALTAAAALPARAEEGPCGCRADFDPCLVGDWLLPADTVHPHWRETAATFLGLTVQSTDGQVELVVRQDRLFHLRIALDSQATAKAGLRLESRITGSPVGRVCVARDGELCTYGVRGKIRLSNQIELSGRRVPMPTVVVPAAGDERGKEQNYLYSCTARTLELSFINLGERQKVTATRR